MENEEFVREDDTSRHNQLNVWWVKYHEPWYRIDLQIKTLFRKIKWSYQRITRGFCDYDVWSLDIHYCRYFRDTITHLRKNCHGYPARYTEEEWDEILKKMSECFDIAQSEFYNKYAEEYLSECSLEDFVLHKGNDELKEKFFLEEQKIYQYRHDKLKEGLDLLSKNFRDLWD